MPTIINDRYALMANPREGRFADVYRASDLQGDGRVVAVKFFRNGMPDDALIRESFERESNRLVELVHDNIVRMLDFGTDSASGRPFLVLEWAGDPVGEWWKKNRLGRSKWEDFYNEIGHPLLEALAFAHSRETVHRELKPTDILRGEDGRIRLADFGIAKFPEFFDAELDIDTFLKDKQPFAPVDGYDANYSYATDVFAFGALAVAFMGGLRFETWDQLYSALKLSTAPAKIREVLEECLAKHANERPINALVLQSKLRNALAAAGSRKEKQPCYFILTHGAQNKLKLVYGSDCSSSKLADHIEQDFAEVAAVERARERVHGTQWGERNPYNYKFYGETLTLVMRADPETRSKLLVVDAYRESSIDKLEQSRDKSWTSPFELQAGEWASRDAGKTFIANLEETLVEQERQAAAEQLERSAEEFFWTWRKILDLRLEQSRNGRSYNYSGYEVDDDRIIFQLEEPTKGDEIGQIWKVFGTGLAGVVEGVAERSLTMLLLEDHSAPRRNGRILVDVSATERQIRKQQQALEAIRDPKTEDLKRLRAAILNPAKCAATVSTAAALEWFNPDLDDNKKNAIAKALDAKDVFILEGPPGTGKTTFIAELILQHLKRWPDKKVLVASQTHLAVDNAIERIAQVRPDLKIVRIGYAEKKVSELARQYLLQKRVEAWSKTVRMQAASFLEQTAKEEGIDINTIRLLLDVSVLYASRKGWEQVRDSEDKSAAEISALQWELDEVDTGGIPICKGEEADAKRAEMLQLQTELEDLRKKRKELSEVFRKQKAKFLKAHPDWAELAESSAEELSEWQKELSGEADSTTKFRRLFELSSEWIQRFFLKEDCQSAILADSDVVAGTCIGVESSLTDEEEFGLCILDEASKATVPEALVPLRRSAKWLLVGDRLQLSPFVESMFRNRRVFEENEISSDVFDQTLLDRFLGSAIPDECKSILTRQHRMVRPIGELVSQVFYGGALESVREDAVVDLSIAIPKPITWFSTSREKNRREQPSGTSSLNVLESQWIATLLQRIDFVYANGKSGRRALQVAVLTGYAAQRDRIRRQLENFSLSNIAAECQTVDNYQGREADVVILSVTRSNKDGKPGFLKDKKRINVALSRARHYLLIVGDSEFCAGLSSAPFFGKVLSHMEVNPDTCAIKEGIE